MTSRWGQLAGALLLVASLAIPAEAARRPKKDAAPVPPPPSVKQGVELWRAGDYPGAVAMWQPFANGGDADAMFNIGQAYKLGRAVPRDAVVARDWYRRAALKGHLPAQANLGILLFQAGEKPEAVRWLKSAADKNEMRAQYVLGVANWNGDGVPRNMTLAYAYLARASAQGLAEATTALGNLATMVSPLERANGWSVATSIAAGNGVPPAFGGNVAPVAVASNDAFRRDQVIKPLPQPVAPVMPAVAVPAAIAPVVSPPRPVAAVATTVPPAAVALPRAVPPVATAQVQAPRIVPAPAVSTAVVQQALPAAPQPRAVPPVVLAQANPSSVPKPATAAPPPAVIPVKPVERPVAPPAAPAGAPVVNTVAIPASVPPAPPKAIEPPLPKPVQVAAVTPKPVAPPKPTPPGWRVQLGAFSKRALAEAAWTDVRTKQKQLVANARPIYTADGNVTKLQMGPYPSKTAARDACAKIAFSGRACFVTEG